MAATAVVRARITEDVKVEASAVAAQMGLTLSDIVRLTLTRVAKDHALPFDVKVPNATTRTTRPLAGASLAASPGDAKTAPARIATTGALSIAVRLVPLRKTD